MIAVLYCFYLTVLILCRHHVHGAINILSCAAYAGELSCIRLQVLELYPLRSLHCITLLLGACCEFMHFRCDNVWNRLAEAAREEQTAGESTAESSSKDTKKRTKPNVLMAVPTIYSKMIEAAEHNVVEPGIVDDAAKTLSEMRLLISGSAACPVSLNEKWKKLTGHILLEVRDDLL